MKKLLVVSAVAALGLSSVVLAGGLPEEMPMAPAAVSTSDAGLYLGLAGGYGMTHWKLLSDSISKDNGAVGRAFLGYDINRYFAVETGFTYFFNTPSVGDVKFVKNTQAIDLMGKGKLPVVDNFDLFAKVGMSYLTSNSDITGVSSANNLNLAYGAGADYYITPNVIVSAEWLRFNGNVKMDIDPSAPITNNKYQPYTDAFMVGLRYKFDM